MKLHVAYLFPLFFMYISPKLIYLCHSGFRQLLPNLANTSLNISSVVVSSSCMNVLYTMFRLKII